MVGLSAPSARIGGVAGCMESKFLRVRIGGADDFVFFGPARYVMDGRKARLPIQLNKMRSACV